jgi:hypothetical protein
MCLVWSICCGSEHIKKQQRAAAFKRRPHQSARSEGGAPRAGPTPQRHAHAREHAARRWCGVGGALLASNDTHTAHAGVGARHLFAP